MTGLGTFRVTDDTINQIWTNQSIKLTGNDPISDEDMEYDREFLGKSKTYQKQITPADAKRKRVPSKKSSPFDEPSYDSELENSSENSSSENSENSDYDSE